MNMSINGHKATPEDEVKLTREEKRAIAKARHAKWAAEVAATARRGTEAGLMAAVRRTNLAYLYHATPKAYATKDEVEVDVHYGNTSSRIKLPAGTAGWVFHEAAVTYDKYVRVDDMDYPAPGARPVKATHYYTFAALVTVDGKPVLAEAMKTVEKEL